jgi:hypothetical protein
VKTPALLLLVLLVGSAVRSADAVELSEIPLEDLFKWGEYDSLIRSLEPVLASQSAGATARGDSLEWARSNLWLGVAYWATEKRPLAEQAFVRACRLDPAIALDRLYATPEMVASFDAIASREREARRSALAAAAAAAGPAAPKPPAAKPWRKRGWAVGAATAVGLAAGGTYLYLSSRKEPEEMIINPTGGPK